MAVLTPDERAFIEAITPLFVPPAAALAPAERAHALDLIDDALGDRPPALRRQFSLLLAVLRWSPVARYGRPLDRLRARQQDAVLRWFQNAPLLKLRAGFWGLRTLIFLGYFGRPEAAHALAYRPVLDGNALLHARTPR